MIHAVWHFLVSMTNTGDRGAGIGLAAVVGLVFFMWLGHDDSRT